jgi:predicted dehydrogenase
MVNVRWGILGAAKIARELVIPAMQAARNARVVALASRDAIQATEMCERFDIARRYNDYDALLAAPDIDAVYIPLPNTLHVEWTLRAIAAGKHVLCEKPLAMRAQEIDPLIAARDKSGLVVGEAFMVAHHPQWRQVRDMLSAGKIGKLMLIEASFAYHNADGANIRNQAALGGGALRDIGVYCVVTARIATGHEPVRVVHARIDWDPNFKTDRLAIAHVDFGDFPLSFYCATQAARRQQVTFHGEAGWIRLETPFNAGVYGEARVVTRFGTSGTSEEITFYPQADHYQLMIENFGDAVAGNTPFAFTLESSRANQRVIDMIFAAANAG